jgi:hypothetical protein
MVMSASLSYDKNRRKIGLSPAADEISGAANQKTVSICAFAFELKKTKMKAIKSLVKFLITSDYR